MNRHAFVGGLALLLAMGSPNLRGANPAEIAYHRWAHSLILTNPDPLAYVELEMLGPLQTLRVGESIRQKNSYRLLRRTGKIPEEEAKAVLGK